MTNFSFDTPISEPRKDSQGATRLIFVANVTIAGQWYHNEDGSLDYDLDSIVFQGTDFLPLLNACFAGNAKDCDLINDPVMDYISKVDSGEIADEKVAQDAEYPLEINKAA